MQSNLQMLIGLVYLIDLVDSIIIDLVLYILVRVFAFEDLAGFNQLIYSF